MTDAIKRIAKSKDASFKDRCVYYMWEKADAVFAEESPYPNELAFAKALYANKVNYEDMSKIVVRNPTIGAKIDSDEKLNPEDVTLTNPILESEIQWVVQSADAGARGFHNLADSYIAAGLIGG